MRSDRCSLDEAVARAARAGRWTDELAAHRDGCAICSEVSLVAAALATDADALASGAQALPDPGIIWLRARLAARERQAKRATRWITMVQKAALACAVSVAIAFAPEAWQSMGHALSTVGFEASAGTGGSGFPFPALVGSLILLGVLALAELTGVKEF